MKIKLLKEAVSEKLKTGNRNEALATIKDVESEALNTLQWIGKTPEDRAEAFANACQVFIHLEENDPKAAITFIDGVGDDAASLGLLTMAQIVVKEVGLPEGGGIPSTIELCSLLAKAGSEYALSKGSKKHAAMLNHNVAAFITPNFDEDIPESLIETGENAASISLELRKEIGAALGISWGEWVVGIYKLARGDRDEALKHFEESARTANEIEDEEKIPIYLGWADLYHGKTLAKLYPKKKNQGIKLMKKAQKLLKNDDWSVKHAESLIERFSK